MKNLFALFAAFVLLTGAAVAQNTGRAVTAAANTDLISQLPASDAVANVNLKRLITDALPQILASKPAELEKINASIEKFKGETGLDARSFEQISVGMKFKQVRAGVIDVEPVALVRGTFNSKGLLALGKVAANGKFRQETVSGKTVYIFTLPEAAKKAAKGAAPRNDKNSHSIDGFFDRLFTGEISVVALDDNTFALGKPAQIRSMLNPKAATLGADLAQLVQRNQNAIISFAGKMPPGAGAMFGIPANDQFGRVFSSMRLLHGSLDMNGGEALLNLAAQTTENSQAQELEEMLLGLQMLGKGFLGSKKGDKDQVMARLVETLSITREANEVQLRARMPQSDLDLIVGGVTIK